MKEIIKQIKLPLATKNHIKKLLVFLKTHYIKLTSLFIALLFFLLIIWIYKLDQKIQLSLANKQIINPIEFYAQPEKFTKGEHVNLDRLVQTFIQKDFRQRKFSQQLFPRDYALFDQSTCQSIIEAEFSESISRCLLFKDSFTNDDGAEEPAQLIIVSSDNIVLATLSGTPLQPTDSIQIAPKMFAQYINNSPILRQNIKLPEVPTQCLQSLLAIEDPNFLDHRGISLKGILRAIITNLSASRAAQGGSTITQQLIKNYFLTHEKSFKRKITEIFMAILFELRVEKDQILETYLNIIYMGQNGSFVLHGMEAASNYYFSKSIKRLKLHECALLSAILNSPGRYNPFNHPERALKRRNRVLEKMSTHNFISEKQKSIYQARELSVQKNNTKTISAPYFVNAAREEIKQLGIPTENGLKVYTSVNLKKQALAKNIISQKLNKLETTRNNIKDNKAKNSLVLQSALISVDNKTQLIETLVGGRNFKLYPFNRAIKAKRQIGSIIKPIVYLTAFENFDEDNILFSPLSIFEDAPFKYEYDKQSWTPQNYSKKYFGKIPLYFALKNSINITTAKLGLEVGLEKIISTAKKLGIKSKIEPFPAMTLGTPTLTVFEVAEAYTAIARFGKHNTISTIRFIKDTKGNLIYKKNNESKQVVSEESAAETLGILQEAIESGTGQLARRLGFKAPAAGKTGTTSQFKDAWFAGLTADKTTITWVGYDKNIKHGLTGASGAIPIWTDYMIKTYNSEKNNEFTWPDSVKTVEIPENTTFNSSNNPVNLIFRNSFNTEELLNDPVDN